jgi:hypothetical protein
MSGGSDDAAKQARRDEQARLAAIARTQGAVNNVFDSPQRAADIADFVKATRQFYGQDLDQQKAVADRQLRFSLARGGQIGSSLQLDKQTQFGKDYAKGLLALDQKARGAGANLEAADQDARGRLISLATSGLDATTAASQAAAAMRSNLQSNQSTAQAQGLGDIFGSFSKFYQDTRDAAERRRGWDATGLSLYQPNTNLGAGYGR